MLWTHWIGAVSRKPQLGNLPENFQLLLQGDLARGRLEDAFSCLLSRAAMAPVSLLGGHAGPCWALGTVTHSGWARGAGAARGARPSPAVTAHRPRPAPGTQTAARAQPSPPSPPLQPPPPASAPPVPGVCPPEVRGDAALPPSRAVPELGWRSEASPRNVPLTCGCGPLGPGCRACRAAGAPPPARRCLLPAGPGRALSWRRGAAVGVQRPDPAANAAGASWRWLMPLERPVVSPLLSCPSPQPYLIRSVRAPSWVS